MARKKSSNLFAIVDQKPITCMAFSQGPILRDEEKKLMAKLLKVLSRTCHIVDARWSFCIRTCMAQRQIL
jgi:hypothetical protein